jgi:hypothetical protein
MVTNGALTAAPLRKGKHFRQDTVLAFPGHEDADLTSVSRLEFLPTLLDWNGLRILLACLRRTPALPSRLTAFIQSMGQAGCQRFRLMDLVEGLQQAARATARELMRSRAGTPVGAREGQEFVQVISRPGDAVGDYSSAGDFQERCRRVTQAAESSCREDARRNRLQVFQVCLPALRQGYWPSVREVVALLDQADAPIAHGSVGDHLRILKSLWEESQ